MALRCLPTRFTTNFALCGLVLLIIFTCKAQQDGNRLKELTARFTRHLVLLKQFSCKDPQPRTVNVRELIGDQLRTSETIQPHMTILHRCDSGTGYCGKEEYECRVSNSTNVSVLFYVTDTVLNTTTGFREYTLNNHTECACQAIGNTIK